MRHQLLVSSFALFLLTPSLAVSQGVLTPLNVTVGSHLQTSSKITLNQQASFEGLQITIKSDDPSRLRLSKRTDAAGVASIVLEINPGMRESPEFWVQGFGDSGQATYSVTADGYGPAKGIATLTPSGIIVMGPFKAPKFPTTPRGRASRITVQSVRLDTSMKVAEHQAVAGGTTAKFTIESTHAAIGKLATSELSIAGGYASTVTDFQPSTLGETTFSIPPPPGFSKPGEFAAVTAMVTKPGLGLTEQIMIGENLQVAGVVGLGEAPPAEGVTITLTSDDPDRLLLAPTSRDKGAASVTIKIGPDSVNTKFYLQALGKQGSATYTATATGYRSRTATVTLAPSGVVITPSPYGPPDEAELFRNIPGESSSSGFVSHLSKKTKMPLVIWTAQLDPETHRSADITVQELRAGMSLQVPLKISDPTVGAVDSYVTIAGGDHSAVTHFKPLRQGSAFVSAVTPSGFTTSANSTSVKAMVKD